MIRVDNCMLFSINDTQLNFLIEYAKNFAGRLTRAM